MFASNVVLLGSKKFMLLQHFMPVELNCTSNSNKSNNKPLNEIANLTKIVVTINTFHLVFLENVYVLFKIAVLLYMFIMHIHHCFVESGESD